MERIRDHWREGMAWRQPRPLVLEFELRRAAHLFAELDLQMRWQVRGRARAFDRDWTIEPVGRWNPSYRFIDQRTKQVALVARSGWRGTFLTTPQDRRYRLRPGLTQYRLEDEAGEEVFRFPFKIRLFRLEADVDIAERASGLPELPDLVVGAWLMVVLSTAYVAAGSAAGASAAASG